MSFSSLSDFLAMGGYGLYVWGSLGMCGAAIVAELALIHARRRALLREADDARADGSAREHAA
jgi:heme exporter protein D